MRLALALVLVALAACSSDPAPTDAGSPHDDVLTDAGGCADACGTGYFCSGSRCVGEGDIGPVDVPPADVGTDGGVQPTDLGPDVPSCTADEQCLPVNCSTDPHEFTSAECDEGAGHCYCPNPDDGGPADAGFDASCNADAGLYPCGASCVAIETDRMNCGLCGTVCPAAASCLHSTCIDVQTDVMNCGAVGNRCMLTNGVASCVSGHCAVGTCSAPFADCDGRADTGCEVNIQTNAAHCGACATACGAGQECFGGACR